MITNLNGRQGNEKGASMVNKYPGKMYIDYNDGHYCIMAVPVVKFSRKGPFKNLSNFVSLPRKLQNR